MKPPRKTWKGTSVAWLLFTIGFLLFNWPLLSIPAEAKDLGIIAYLLFLWMVFIFSLWTYCRNEAAPAEERSEEGHT